MIRSKGFLHQPQVDSTHCMIVVFKSAVFCRLERCRIAVSVSGTQLPFTLVGNLHRPLVRIRAYRLCACTGTRLGRTRRAVVTTIRRARLRSRGTTSGQRISIRVILLTFPLRLPPFLSLRLFPSLRCLLRILKEGPDSPVQLDRD